MWPSQGNQSHRNNTHTHPHAPSLSRAQLFRSIQAYRMSQLEKIPAVIQQWFPSIIFFFNFQDPLLKGFFMEIQCVKQSAAMSEEKSEVKIIPTPTQSVYPANVHQTLLAWP